MTLESCLAWNSKLIVWEHTLLEDMHTWAKCLQEGKTQDAAKTRQKLESILTEHDANVAYIREMLDKMSELA